MKTITSFDPKELESKVKAMYRSVAEDPHGEFHFEMGRAMAERLGYAPADLDRIPAEAIESFAGVGYYFHLADAKPGETVVFAWIVFKSKSHRDKVNAKVMKDPRLASMCDPKNLPFDCKRVVYGGFSVMVDA